MRKLVVNNKYNGKKLNTFLLDNFDGLSLNTIYKALRKKDIRINNILKKSTKTDDKDKINVNDKIKKGVFDFANTIDEKLSNSSKGLNYGIETTENRVVDDSDIPVKYGKEIADEINQEILDCTFGTNILNEID